MKYLPFFLSCLLYLAVLLWGASTWLLAGASTEEEWQEYESVLEKLAPSETPVSGSTLLLNLPEQQQSPNGYSQMLGQELDEIRAPGAILYAFRENSGQILWQQNMDMPRPTASMAKLMSLLLVQELLRDYDIDLEQVQQIPYGGAAAQRPFDASIAGLRTGMKFSWKKLLAYTIIASANDAIYALAILSERIRAPKETLTEREAVESFVMRMQHRAAELGLNSAHFVDPDGWSEQDFISPLDMARLSAFYIQSFPEILKLHQQKFIELVPGLRKKTGRIKRNTNMLLSTYTQVDGLKTGFTYEAGFNFCATVKRGEWRYIAVIMGIQEQNIALGILRRAAEAEILLDWGLSHFIPLWPDAPESAIKSLEASSVSLASFSRPSWYLPDFQIKRNRQMEEMLHSRLAWRFDPGPGLGGKLGEEPEFAQRKLIFYIDEQQLHRMEQKKDSPYLGFASVSKANSEPRELGYLLLGPEQHSGQRPLVQENSSRLLRLRWSLIELLWPLLQKLNLTVGLRPYALMILQ